MTESFLVPEPDLFFGKGGKGVHPQVGLLNHGPHRSPTEPGGHREIRYGSIGTEEALNQLSSFLSDIASVIHGRRGSSNQTEDFDFPGLRPGSPLEFSLIRDENHTHRFEDKLLQSLEREKNRHRRIETLVEEYQLQLQNCREGHAPDLVLLPLDQRIMELCRDPHGDENKIVYQRKTLAKSSSKTPPPLCDFHDRIKAVAAHLSLPSQILRPKTLLFKETQPKSVTAWNFAVGQYYKATGSPWKLTELEPDTCYVGIRFFQDVRTGPGTLQTAVAQVYMQRGESQVIRGGSFAWDIKREGRDIYLTQEEMRKIVSGGIKLFHDQSNGRKVRRLIVHKKGPFNAAEIDGIEGASSPAERIDAVHIQTLPRFNAFVADHDYPVVRGTAIGSGNEAFLFTTGYIPAIATYPGAGVPRPIALHAFRQDSHIRILCSDVIGLTRLDWNTSSFATREPVTISVPEKVGEVLAEMGDLPGSPPPSYRYYM